MNPSVSTHLFAFDLLRENHLRLIAEAGFGHVELWGGTPHFDFDDDAAVARVQAWLRDAGLSVRTVHLPFYEHFGQPNFRYISFADADPAGRRLMGERSRRLIDLCGVFGCDCAILHPAGGQLEDAWGFDYLRRELDWFAPHCAARGVTLALENIMMPGTRTGELAAFCREYGPTVRLCLDLGHAHVDGGVVAEIMDGGEHIVALHVHDNDGDEDEHNLPGRGSIDWPAALTALAAHAPGVLHFTFELMLPLTGAADDRYREMLAQARTFWETHYGKMA
ncbi:MAG TPA: sugar phosphate isomerase/epimerase family protein [bacterium]|nr:sugar phosphate isomerase/epimerase family protein [bacterium]